MIKLLKKISGVKKSQIGNRAFDLWKVQQNGLKIAETIILSKDEFSEFRSVLELEPTKTEMIKKLILDHFPNKISRINVLSSLICPCPGIHDHIETSRSILQVKHAIERIQRSYWDEKAVAWRIIHKKSDLQNLPAIIIQPHFKETLTITTRSPQTGAPTNNTNLSEAENNNIKMWSEEYTPFLQKIEMTLTRGCKVYFRINDGFIINLIEELSIPAPAYFRYLTDLLDNNIIDSIEYLMRIQPDNFISLFDLDLTKEMQCGFFKSEGQPLSNGMGIGKLVFLTSKFSLLNNNNYIIVSGLFDPDYEYILRNSDGAIQSKGGYHGHLGIIARALEIPAVSLDVEINEINKIVILKSGAIINEFSNTLVFANKGIVIFDCDKNLDSILFIKKSLKIYLRLITEIIFKLLHPKKISQLNINEQQHIKILWLKLAIINRDYHLKIKELSI